MSDNNGAKNVHVDNGRRFVLTLSCDDKPGLTAAVTGTLARHDGNILEAQQYRDPLSIRFFMR
ncbi:MAG: ACT domain-containing protein, partial [Luteimonas sp.]|nr:ACT domain-containing protein [Luteimonas sp.]